MGEPTEAGTDARSALVTGGSRGLGSVLATLLGGRGYDLILTARGDDDLEAKIASLQAADLGVDLHAVIGDVADPEHRDELHDVVDDLGRLDVGPGDRPRPADRRVHPAVRHA